MMRIEYVQIEVVVDHSTLDDPPALNRYKRMKG